VKRIYFRKLLLFQCVGVDLSPYPKLKAWYKNCGILPGYEENMAGAVNFGERVKTNLTEGF